MFVLSWGHLKGKNLPNHLITDSSFPFQLPLHRAPGSGFLKHFLDPSTVCKSRWSDSDSPTHHHHPFLPFSVLQGHPGSALSCQTSPHLDAFPCLVCLWESRFIHQAQPYLPHPLGRSPVASPLLESPALVCNVFANKKRVIDLHTCSSCPLQMCENIQLL